MIIGVTNYLTLLANNINVHSFTLATENYFTPNMTTRIKQYNVSFSHEDDNLIKGVSCDSASMHKMLENICDMYVWIRADDIEVQVREIDYDKVIEMMKRAGIHLLQPRFWSTTIKDTLEIDMHAFHVYTWQKAAFLNAIETELRINVK